MEMKQDKVAGEVLLELMELGVVHDDHQEIVFERLQRVYAAGHNSGRQLRSNHRAVAQYSWKGELLDVFDSVQNAVRKTRLNKSNIANCARGRKGCDTCGGFRWQYVDLTEPTSVERQILESMKLKQDLPEPESPLSKKSPPSQ